MEDSMVMDSFGSNLNSNETSCKYYIVKAISLDKLIEMQNMGIFEPLNSNIRNKIIVASIGYFWNWELVILICTFLGWYCHIIQTFIII